MNKPNYNILTPFKRWTIQNFPFIEEDFDAITNYQLLCKIVEYLNKINENEKELEKVNNELIDAFINLKDYVDDYFENLDIQTEIDNKLDEMAESGQLADIIAQYIELAGVLAYNTVADMKEATNIVNGSIMQTLGYHSINDGGKAIYKAREILNSDVIDEGSIIALNDPTLVAELVIDDNVNVKVFGAYGDNTHDDTTAISNAMIYGRTNKLAVYFPRGKYIVTDNLPNLDAGSILYGEVGFTGDGSYHSQIIDNRTTSRSWLIQYYQVDSSHLLNERGTTIKNLAFINEDENSEETKWLINFRYILENVVVENVFVEGYERLFYANDTNNFIFRNIRCIKIGSYTNSESKYYAFEFQGLFGTLFDNIQVDASRYMFKLTTRDGSDYACQTRFTNCHFEQGHNFNTVSSASSESLFYIDTGYVQTFENCMFVPAEKNDYASNSPYMIYGTETSELVFNNCYFVGGYTGHRQNMFIWARCLINNCIFENCATNRSIRLYDNSEVNNSVFNCYIDSDITSYDNVVYNNIINMPNSNNNILNLNIVPTKLSIVPSLFFINKEYTMTTNSKYNISQRYQISNKWTNVFKIQKTNSGYDLNRYFKIKIFDTRRGDNFYYEGIIKLTGGNTLSKIDTILETNISTYPIDVWLINDDIYIQMTYTSDYLNIEVEDIKNTQSIIMMDNTGLDTTGYSSHIYIDS